MPARTLPAVIAVTVLVGVLVAGAYAQDQRPRFAPPVQSPEVTAERRATFRIRAEQAQSVRLSSSDLPGLGPGAAMAKGEGGLWEVTIGPVDPGTYRYRINLDGVDVNDPVNASVSESNGNTWSLLHVPGAAWMDVRDVKHGLVSEVVYYSRALQKFRRMHVYTPPGYAEGGTDAYPVLYLLHGAFDCDDSWTTVGRAGIILDNLLADGHAEPMIVVMPAGHTGPFAFGRGQLPIDEFTQDFEQEIVPYVESNFRVRKERASRAVAGLSMGGAQTLNVALRKLDQYGYVGVFSSGVFGIAGGPGAPAGGPTWEEQHAAALDDEALKSDLKLVWFATGKDDFLLPTTQATVEMLKKHKFDVVYQETAGGHTWINWREYLHEFYQLLFREHPNPAPISAAQSLGGAAGRWAAEFNTPLGEQRYVFTLQLADGKLTGTATADIAGERHESLIVDGRVEGQQVHFVEQLKFQGADLRIEYSGALAGDRMQLTRKVGDFSEETLVARRVVDGAALDPPRSAPAARPAVPDTAPLHLEVTAAQPPAGFDQPRPDVPHGALETIEYDSKTVGVKRKLVVYTPPRYSTAASYPVLYLLHGIGDSEVGWTRERAHGILDNLLAEQLIQPMIVVMPYGRASAAPRPANIFDRSEFGAYANFEKELLEDVIPLVESRYAVKRDRESRALAGLSMGGGQSLNFGLRNLDAFAWIGGFSSAPNTIPAADLVAKPDQAAQQLKLLWVSCGDRDGLLSISHDFHQALDAMKVPHQWHVYAGGHDFDVWRSNLFDFSRLLFR